MRCVQLFHTLWPHKHQIAPEKLIAQEEIAPLKNVNVEMRDTDEDQLVYALHLTRSGNENLYYNISGVTQNCSSVSAAQLTLQARISASDRASYQTYLLLNPGLTVNQV